MPSMLNIKWRAMKALMTTVNPKTSVLERRLFGAKFAATIAARNTGKKYVKALMDPIRYAASVGGPPAIRFGLKLIP